MTPIAVKICAVGDPPPFPDLGEAYDTACRGFVILEKGTLSGKTSCAIVANDKNGNPLTIQFTGDMFLAMAAALKGARQRFGDPWTGA